MNPAQGGALAGGFGRFWWGEAVSGFGDAVTLLALQTLVVVTLRGGAVQVGWLNSARWLPYLVLGLLVGALVDRVRRRPLMMATDLSRAVLLGLIPLASQDAAETFFCGGSRNFSDFIDLFDGVFVLEIDRGTLHRRLDQRPKDEWGGRQAERQLVERLHQSGEDTPNGLAVDATMPVVQVVDEILASTALAPGDQLRSPDGPA